MPNSTIYRNGFGRPNLDLDSPTYPIRLELDALSTISYILGYNYLDERNDPIYTSAQGGLSVRPLTAEGRVPKFSGKTVSNVITEVLSKDSYRLRATIYNGNNSPVRIFTAYNGDYTYFCNLNPFDTLVVDAYLDAVYAQSQHGTISLVVTDT